MWKRLTPNQKAILAMLVWAALVVACAVYAFSDLRTAPVRVR